MLSHYRIRSDDASVFQFRTVKKNGTGSDPAVVPYLNSFVAYALLLYKLIKVIEIMILRMEPYELSRNYILTDINAACSTEKAVVVKCRAAADLNALADVLQASRTFDPCIPSDNHMVTDIYAFFRKRIDKYTVMEFGLRTYCEITLLLDLDLPAYENRTVYSLLTTREELSADHHPSVFPAERSDVTLADPLIQFESFFAGHLKHLISKRHGSK